MVGLMIIVDSNIFIFAENGNAEEHELAIKKIKLALNEGTFGINLVVASETFHILGRLLGVKEAAARTANIVGNPLAEWLDFSDNDFVEAVALSEKMQIRINDALIAQQALVLGAQVLTDNVKHFKKIKGLKILPLR